MKEGFWYEGRGSKLPMPVGSAIPWNGKSGFLVNLRILEAKASNRGQKGSSTCRICKCRNGSTEFDYRGWKWPAGFRHYVEGHNVKPSKAFQRFVAVHK